MSRVVVGTLAPEPGQVRRGMLSVPGVTPTWEMPVVVARGRRPGPTFTITSGLHAGEYVPIEAVTRFTRELDLDALRGTVIAVLIVNLPGYFEHSLYVNPRDGKNMNRVFPGDSSGTDSERVAAFLAAEVIDGADAFLDAHCGDLTEALMPFVICIQAGDAEVDRQSGAMAEAFGLDYVMTIGPESIKGTASGTAAARGIPAISAEAGQQGICDAAYVDRYLGGLRHLASHLGMLPAQATAPAQPTRLREFAWTRASHTGTFFPAVRVGQSVVEGQRVGSVRDLFGEEIEDVRASAAGVVTFCVTSPPVQEGSPLLGVGVLD